MGEAADSVDLQERVREALANFLRETINDLSAEVLDDILVTYVVSILEDLTQTSGRDSELEDVFDVQAFAELLEAYVPAAKNIKSSAITSWMLGIVDKIKSENNKDVKFDLDLRSVIEETTKKAVVPNAPTKPASSTVEEMKPKSRRVSRLSETSDPGSEGSFDGEDLQQLVSQLLEMFPYSCDLEVAHCVQLMGFDVERASQLIMHRHENGQSLKPTDRKMFRRQKGSGAAVDQKSVKERIVGKYGFVDQDEDARYHRPTLHKDDEKKMIRYRDGKIVSTKGERFTQVSKQESEEMKKSLMNSKQVEVCPYDPRHVMKSTRFQYHLVQCAQKHEHLNFATCPYDATHRLPQDKLEEHLTTCSGRMAIEASRVPLRKGRHGDLSRPLVYGSSLLEGATPDVSFLGQASPFAPSSVTNLDRSRASSVILASAPSFPKLKRSIRTEPRSPSVGRRMRSRSRSKSPGSFVGSEAEDEE